MKFFSETNLNIYKLNTSKSILVKFSKFGGEIWLAGSTLIYVIIYRYKLDKFYMTEGALSHNFLYLLKIQTMMENTFRLFHLTHLSFRNQQLRKTHHGGEIKSKKMLHCSFRLSFLLSGPSFFRRPLMMFVLVFDMKAAWEKIISNGHKLAINSHRYM